MSDQSMVERAARAAYDEAPDRTADALAIDWRDLPMLKRKLWMLRQRAAIAAMREPTEPQRFAGMDARKELDTVNNIYRAMIDAVLKP